MNKTLFAGFLSLTTLLTACHIRGGEPSQDELFSALQDQFEHANDRGGIKINMGNAGAFQNIQFKFKLHHLQKHACTGANNVYTCKITISVSYPPVKEELESIETSMVVFDGPDGWRMIE